MIGRSIPTLMFTTKSTIIVTDRMIRLASHIPIGTHTSL
jgi:hypothetical protein